MFHLVLGFLTEHREGDPTVIFCGADGDAAMQAATQADPKFLRVEKAFVLDSFKVREGVTTKLNQLGELIQSTPVKNSPPTETEEVPDAGASGTEVPEDGPQMMIDSPETVEPKKSKKS